MPGVVAKRLRWYWQVEAFNVLVVPVSTLVMVLVAGGAPSVPLVLAMLANVLLLMIGACYWRVVLRQLEGDGAPFRFWIPRLAWAEPFAAGLTGLAVLATGGELWLAGGQWSPDRIAAVALSVLAVLEYLNYYRVQLQYFDHLPDFWALLRRRSLKRSHMARDIAAWRRTRRAC